MNKLENYSVIMSIYDKVDENHLLASINSILNQTYKTNEFIIIKDGKLTKKQEKVINEAIKKSPNIFKCFEFENNQGAGIAYNKGLEMCTNKWAAIMDSDDYAVPEKFEKQMNYLLNNPEIDLIGSNAVEFIDSLNNVVSYRKMPENQIDIIKFAHSRCPMIQPTVIFKVEAVRKSGSYQHSPLTEDYDLYIRMIENGYIFYNYQEILYYVRTSKVFFQRRGGIKYLKPILNFKYKHFKNGFFSLFEFLKTSLASLIVSLMPNCLRATFYKLFLRETKHEGNN